MITFNARNLYSPLFTFLLCAFMVGSPAPLEAQITAPPQEGTETDTRENLPVWPEDSLGRRTPRGTVSGFISAIADQNYRQASHYLKIGDRQDPDADEELAQVFRSLLDYGGQIYPYSWLSNEIGGRANDDLPPELDRVGTITFNNNEFDLFVEEVKDAEGGPLWLFSSETVNKVEELSLLDGNILLVERILPNFLENRKWGGVSIGQWLIMVLLAILAYLISWGIIRTIRILLPYIWRKAGTEPTSGIIKAFALPIRLYLALWLFIFFTQEVGLSIIIRQSLSRITVIIGMVALFILLWQLADSISRFSQRQMTMRGNVSGLSVVLFIRRAAKVGIVIFGIIAILGAFEVDVTTGLAALGIGGIALALGAQKTIENFVGSVTVIADQPIRIGDFCKVGDTIGTVEKIGMRSTRIRTLNRTVVTIPNGEFSSSKIENYAHRDRFWLNHVFGVRYETSPDQMRYLLVELRKIIYSHPKMDPEPARVRFTGMGDSSLNIEIFAYANVLNFEEFLEVKEDVLLRMMDVVEGSGTGFAFPSQTVYFARDGGLSAEKTRASEEQVRNWRENKAMPLPGFDPDQIEEMKNKLDYPPEGSVRRNKPPQ